MECYIKNKSKHMLPKRLWPSKVMMVEIVCSSSHIGGQGQEEGRG